MMDLWMRETIILSHLQLRNPLRHSNVPPSWKSLTRVWCLMQVITEYYCWANKENNRWVSFKNLNLITVQWSHWNARANSIQNILKTLPHPKDPLVITRIFLPNTIIPIILVHLIIGRRLFAYSWSGIRLWGWEVKGKDDGTRWLGMIIITFKSIKQTTCMNKEEIWISKRWDKDFRLSRLFS